MSLRKVTVSVGCLLSLLGASLVQAGEPAYVVQPHVWKNATMIGTGFVSGIIYHRTEKDLVYARTDMGGGYRLDPATRRWIPLTDHFTEYQETGIESIALDPRRPDRVYFASGTAAADWAGNGNILRSDDRGATWQTLPLPFKLAGNGGGRGIGERLAVDPNDGNVLYYASRFAGFWKSPNRGETWQKVDGFNLTIKDKPANLGMVFLDPRLGTDGQGSKTIYVGTTTQLTEPSLYRSTDGGQTFAAIPGQPSGYVPHHAELMPNGVLYVTYCNADGPNGTGTGAVWKLDTATDTWTDITPVKPGVNGEPGFGYAGLGVDRSNPDTLVVSSLCRWARKDELWRSTDGGQTWKGIFQSGKLDLSDAPYTYTPHWMSDVEIDPHKPDRLYFTTGNGVIGTENLTDADQNKPVNFSIKAHGIEEAAVLDVMSTPTGAHLFSASRDVGGFRHDNLAVSPASGNFTNPKSSQVNNLDFAQNNPDFLVRAQPGKEYAAFSADNGVTWIPLVPNPASTGSNSAAISSDGQTITVVPEKSLPYVTDDRGQSWTVCKGLPESTRQIIADRVDPRIFYAADITKATDSAPAELTLYRSTDSARTFSVTSITPGIEGFRRFQAHPQVAGELWIPLGGSGLARSTDGGATVTKVAGPRVTHCVGFGQAAPNKTRSAIFITGVIGDWDGAFRSDDDGATWIRANDEKNRFGNLVFAITGDPRIYGRVYIATNGRGVVYADIAK